MTQRDDVVDPREHRAGRESLEHEGGQQQPERPVGADDPQLVTEGGARRDAGPDRRRPGAAPRTVGPEGDEGGDEEADDAVAPDGPERVTDGRGRAAADEDREGEDRDPPRHEPGALVVVVGDLGRHRDVGHLEEAVGRRAGEVGHGHPSGREPLRRRRAEEEQREGGREEQSGSDEEGSPAAVRVRRPVADAARDRVEHDVPRLGREDDDPGGRGRHAEPVGEVGQQEQARAPCRTTPSRPTRGRSRGARKRAGSGSGAGGVAEVMHAP